MTGADGGAPEGAARTSPARMSRWISPRSRSSSPEGAVLKAAGKPGKATFTLKTGPDGYRDRRARDRRRRVVARGAAQLGRDGAMQNVKLFAAPPVAGDDLKLDMQGGAT